MKTKTNRVSSLALVLPLAFLLSACAGANWNTGPNASTAGAPCPCCAKMAAAMGCPIGDGSKKSCCSGCCTTNAAGVMACSMADSGKKSCCGGGGGCCTQNASGGMMCKTAK